MIDKDLKDKLNYKFRDIVNNINSHLDINKIKFYLNLIDSRIITINIKIFQEVNFMLFLKYNITSDKIIFDNDDVVNFNDTEQIIQLIWNIYYNKLKSYYFHYNEKYKVIQSFDDFYNMLIDEDFINLEKIYQVLPDFYRAKIEYLINAKKFDLI